MQGNCHRLLILVLSFFSNDLSLCSLIVLIMHNFYINGASFAFQSCSNKGRR
uniref:Uncharacterized protein n=1 Tax=Anguilla anguilla TaxID=7936 RepID=A0A0E9QI22_ANGAN